MCRECDCCGRFRIINYPLNGGDTVSEKRLIRQAPIERFIEPCILLLLSVDPSYGYQLMKNLKKQCGEIIDVGNFYRTLRRMERDSWVVSSWKEEDKGPKKRVYTVTPEGIDFLHSAALGFEQSKAQIERFLKKYREVFKKMEVKEGNGV